VAFVDALRKVPAEQRRALVLYNVCDLSVAQIATETGVPDGTRGAGRHREGPPGPGPRRARAPPA
jgi:DNA-directed RNA polymerase specialized sigma24 family protein